MQLKNIILFLFFAYFGLFFFTLFFSNPLMFYPPKTGYKDSDQIIKLKTKDGKLISAIYLHNKNAKYTILVSHGNGTDIGYMMPIHKLFFEHGFSVFAYDYHGYGTSEGSPSEKTTYQDLNAAYDFLTNTLHIPPQNIIAYGQSLGAALAIDLASKEPIAGIILQSPFVEAFRVVTRFHILPISKYNNLRKLKKIHTPILIIHGTKDRTIGIWHGKKLYKTAHSPKLNLWVKGANHNNVFSTAGANYWNSVYQFMEMVSKAQLK